MRTVRAVRARNTSTATAQWAEPIVWQRREGSSLLAPRKKLLAAYALRAAFLSEGGEEKERCWRRCRRLRSASPMLRNALCLQAEKCNRRPKISMIRTAHGGRLNVSPCFYVRYSILANPRKIWVFKKVVAPRVGFEPTAIRLTVECSTAELSGSSPAFAGQAAPICSGVCFGNPIRDFVLPKRENYCDYAMNCSVTIRSSRLWPGSNSRVSSVSGSIRSRTLAMSRSSF